MLWELSHRRVPYAGREPMSVALEVVRSNLRPQINSDVDPTLRGMTIMCLYDESKVLIQ